MNRLLAALSTGLVSVFVLASPSRACPVAEFSLGWNLTRPSLTADQMTTAQREQWAGSYYDPRGFLGLSFSPSEEQPLTVAIPEGWQLLDASFESNGELLLTFGPTEWRSEIWSLRLRVSAFGVCTVVDEEGCVPHAERMGWGRATSLRSLTRLEAIAGAAASVGVGAIDRARNWARTWTVDFTGRSARR